MTKHGESMSQASSEESASSEFSDLPDASGSSTAPDSARSTRVSRAPELPFILAFGVSDADRETWDFLATNLGLARYASCTYLSLEQATNSIIGAQRDLQRADILVVIRDSLPTAFE